MNTTRGMDQEVDDRFLKLVNFKWLMAGVGWRVSLSRLQSDSGYINECLQPALASDAELLRDRGNDLLRFLLDPNPSTTRRSNARRAADAATDSEHRTLEGNEQ